MIFNVNLTRRIASNAFLILFLGFSSVIAQARDLTGRLGLGYNAEFGMDGISGGIPAISVKYGIAKGAQFQLVGGYDSGTPSSGVAAIKYLQTIFPENYVNFYFVTGLGYLSLNSKSGVDILAGFGAEFFIPGLESIGFSFEAGGSIDNTASTSFAIKTFGASFINAGMHFYF